MSLPEFAIDGLVLTPVCMNGGIQPWPSFQKLTAEFVSTALRQGLTHAVVAGDGDRVLFVGRIRAGSGLNPVSGTAAYQIQNGTEDVHPIDLVAEIDPEIGKVFLASLALVDLFRWWTNTCNRPVR